MSKNLVEYSISEDSNSLNILAKVNFPIFQKTVLIITYILLIIVSIYVIQLSVTEHAPLWFWLIVDGSFIGFVCAGIIIYRFSMNNSSWKLILNKNTKKLECPNEKYSINTDEVKNVSLNPGLITGTVNGLRIVSDRGEKTLKFPVTNYERGEEIIKKIKENI